MRGSTLTQAAFLVVSSSVLTTAYAVRRQTADCTASSLTTPSWLIENVQYSTGESKVTFTVRNRATDSLGEATCSTSGACTVSGASPTVTIALSEQGEKTRVSFQVSETWTCSDKTAGKPITFAASGSNSLELECVIREGSTDFCPAVISTPVLVRGSLSLPVQINPTYAEGPLGHNEPNCAATSLSWKVDGTQYNRRTIQTPTGPRSSGSLGLFLVNSATGYIAACGGFFGNETGPLRMPCSGQDVFRPREKHLIQTEAIFDRVTETISVSETWFCDGNNPSAPVKIQGAGSLKLPFECQIFEDDESETPTVTTFCSGPETEVTIPGKVTGQTLMPPYALKDPLATAESCTLTSLTAPTWSFNGFEVITNGNTQTITFGIELLTGRTAAGYPTIVSNKVTLSGEPAWVSCVFLTAEPVFDAANCAFKYDVASQSLSVRASWGCSDLDTAHPITFSGIVETKLPGLVCTKDEDSSVCATYDGTSWTSGTGSVSWRSSGQ